MEQSFSEIQKNAYLISEKHKKDQLDNDMNMYSKDDFLSDLQKVCNPINKTDKSKLASSKT